MIQEAGIGTADSDESADVGRRAVRSGVVQMGSQAVQVLLMLATGIVLARILEPRDFGLYAMANTLMAFVLTFRDLGIPMAIAQREKLSNAELTALFRVNLRVNAIIAAGIAVSAPLLAWLYREPKLIAITVLMAGGSFAAGLAVQPEGLLMRRMKFPLINAIEIASYAAGSAIAIVVAARGGGYWALAIQFVAIALVRSSAIWVSAGWRPVRVRAETDDATHHDMLSYGRNFSGFRAMDHVARHLGQILVGVSQGATAAGFYYNAYAWAGYPVQKVLTPLQRIAVSGLSRLQHDPARYLSALSRGSLLVTGLVLPLLTFFVVEPSLTIGVILGAKWLPAAPIFRMLSLAAIAMAVTRLALWINLSMGNAGRQFRWGILRAIVLGGAAVIGLRWGAVGVATAYAVASWVQSVPEILYCLAGTRIRPRDFAAMVWRPLICCAVAATALILSSSSELHAQNEWPRLAASAAIFLLAYVVAWLALPGGATLAVTISRVFSRAELFGGTSTSPGSRHQ